MSNGNGDNDGGSSGKPQMGFVRTSQSYNLVEQVKISEGSNNKKGDKLMEQNNKQNEVDFCKVFLAGVYGINPEELTREYLSTQKEEKLKKQRNYAKENGLIVVKSDEVDVFINEKMAKYERWLKQFNSLG